MVVDDQRRDGTQTVTVTASLAGWMSGSADMSVLDAPASTPFSGGCAPGTGRGGWATGALFALVAALGIRRRASRRATPLRAACVLALASLVLHGCAGTAPIGEPRFARVAFLADGGGAGEESSPIVEGGDEADHDAAAQAKPPEDAPTGGRPRRFGVRWGALMPTGAADEGYSDSTALGFFFAGRLPGILGLAEIPFELGLDFASSVSSDGRVDADFYTLRFDCLFSKWAQVAPDLTWYVLGGYQVVFASPEVEGERADLEFVSGFSAGAGIVSLDRRWDARVAYSVLAGSGNLLGFLGVNAGYRF